MSEYKCFKCTSCKNGIFDKKWGEWKCRIFEHIIYRPEATEYCGYYKEKKKEKTNDQERNVRAD